MEIAWPSSVATSRKLYPYMYIGQRDLQITDALVLFGILRFLYNSNTPTSHEFSIEVIQHFNFSLIRDSRILNV